MEEHVLETRKQNAEQTAKVTSPTAAPFDGDLD